MTSTGEEQRHHDFVADLVAAIARRGASVHTREIVSAPAVSDPATEARLSRIEADLEAISRGLHELVGEVSTKMAQALRVVVEQAKDDRGRVAHIEGTLIEIAGRIRKVGGAA